MVRATQKGEMENPSPEVAKIASTVSKSDVKKMASTKHKGLPEKKEVKEAKYDNTKSPDYEKKKAALAKKHGGYDKIKGHPQFKEGRTLEVVAEKKNSKRVSQNPYGNTAEKKAAKREDDVIRRKLGLPKRKKPTKDYPWDDRHEAVEPVMEVHPQFKEGRTLEVVKGLIDEERAARRLNVRSKKTIHKTVADDAAKEAKRRANKTGEYKESPKKKPKVGLSYTTKVTGTSKPAPKPAPRTQKGAMAYDGPNKERSEAADRVKAKTKAKRAAKKTPVTKATTTKPAPKKAPARKSVKKTPVTKAAATKTKTQPKTSETKSTAVDKLKSAVKAGVKRHKKAVQPARVFAKGFKKGVKDTAKFAVKAKKAIVGEGKTFSQFQEQAFTILSEAKVDNVKHGDHNMIENPGKEKARNERKFGKVGWNQRGQTQVRRGVHWSKRGEKKQRGAKVVSEGRLEAVSKMVRAVKRKKQVLNQPHKYPKGASGGDAGAKAKKILRDKEHKKYVNFLPADESYMPEAACPPGQYFCRTSNKCMAIPDGCKVRKDGELVKK